MRNSKAICQNIMQHFSLIVQKETSRECQMIYNHFLRNLLEFIPSGVQKSFDVYKEHQKGGSDKQEIR